GHPELGGPQCRRVTPASGTQDDDVVVLRICHVPLLERVTNPTCTGPVADIVPPAGHPVASRCRARAVCHTPAGSVSVAVPWCHAPAFAPAVRSPPPGRGVPGREQGAHAGAFPA